MYHADLFHGKKSQKDSENLENSDFNEQLK